MKSASRFVLVLVVAALVALLALAACRRDVAPAAPVLRAPVTTADAGAPREDTLVELVESWPVETTLDHPDIRDAHVVWPEMIDRAKRTLDFAEFYASDAPAEHAGASRLTKVLEAVERALGRGVRVRFLADASFAKTYPAVLERLERAGAQVRRYDVAKTMGGVLHAKYFVVDGEEAFLGSQNFDWRALAHIQELGVRVRAVGIASRLADVFELDWAAAVGETAALPEREGWFDWKARAADLLVFGASPGEHLPDARAWDLPLLVRYVDHAQKSVAVQLLTYAATYRDGSPFLALDDALRRAARRGVEVKLLVSHWANKPKSASRRSLEELARFPNVEVRILTIPPWSGGDIPFARVAHAKYLVVDRDRAWIGTSNWEGDYFTRSRNVGLFVTHGSLPSRLARFFDDTWSSAYARPLAISSADAGP